MTTIVKATSKGQITIPMSWRKQFNTDQFMLQYTGNTLVIKPIHLEAMLKKEERKGYKTVFNAIRDNKGKGIDADDLLKVLQKIDG